MHPQEITTYFIDESGHSGDLAKPHRGLDFLEQPHFVLGAVGVSDDANIAAELARLRADHNLPSRELKAKSLGSKPAFVEAIVDLVLQRKMPVLLEVVDKRYYVGIHLVQFMLRHGIDMKEGPALHTALNTLAEVIYQEAPDNLLTGFIDACAAPSDSAIMTVFGRLFLLEAATPRYARNEPALRMLTEVAHAAGVAYVEARNSSHISFERFIPPADRNRGGKPVRMLPNQTCFTNICARINVLRGGRLKGVRLVHDEQLEVANILVESKAKMETFKDSSFRPYTPHADYLVDDGATLSFDKSGDEPGIQVADILTGTAMRFCRDLTCEPASIQPSGAQWRDSWELAILERDWASTSLRQTRCFTHAMRCANRPN